MPRTRSSKANIKSLTNSPSTKHEQNSPNQLPPASTALQKVFILPKKASNIARIITLPHPRSGKLARYLLCPETGIYEFTRIAYPRTSPTSWLLKPEVQTNTLSISRNADLHIATSIDPLFLLLPTLSAKSSANSKRLFLSLDHHLDNFGETSSNAARVFASEKLRFLLEGAIQSVCDCIDAGEECMYRLSEQKLLDYMLEKAYRLSEPTLPASMEERFVQNTLAAPIINTSSCPNVNGEIEINSTSADSLVTIDQSQPPLHIVVLQRRKVAFDFICSSYISPSLAEQLYTLLMKSKSPVDFSPLNEFIASIVKLKREAVAARALVDYTRKRGYEDEKAAERIKKHKKEDDEKRKKANGSRGLRELKKVNTSGMKKLNEFFKKK